MKAETNVKTRAGKSAASFEAAAETPRAANVFAVPQFEMPKFEMPKFEMSNLMPGFGSPNLEVPAALRDWAEKGVAQTKDAYQRMKSVADESAEIVENTYTTAAKGTAEYGLRLIENARANTNSAFDFARDLMSVKSLSEAVEVSTAHARQQFETLTAQAREMTSLAQKVASETIEPVKAGATKAFKLS